MCCIVFHKDSVVSWQLLFEQEAAGAASQSQQHLCCRLVSCTDAPHQASMPAWLTCASDVNTAPPRGCFSPETTQTQESDHPEGSASLFSIILRFIAVTKIKRICSFSMLNWTHSVGYPDWNILTCQFIRYTLLIDMRASHSYCKPPTHE